MMNATMKATAILVVLAVALTGCGSDDDAVSDTTAPQTAAATADESTAAATPAVAGTITVSAAASLTGVFTTLEEAFTAANPDATIDINFGSSGQLSTQIQSGAPADLAAFADEAPMAALDKAGLLAGPAEIFARNQLVIVTKPGNPKGISSLADLATAGIISLCADTAPCGKFANQALASAAVSIPENSVTRGQDVKATLTAVAQGDAEAAIVYVTDAAASGDSVATVEIPEADNVVAKYPIAVLGSTQNIELAEAFMAFVLSDDGQAALGDAGFLSK